MKWLFALLLAVNAAYFAWQTMTPPPGKAAAVPPPANGLFLLGELPHPPQLRSPVAVAAPAQVATPAPHVTGAPADVPAPGAAPAPSPAQTPEEPPKPQCYRLSGLESEGRANELAQRYSGLGARVRSGKQQSEHDRYWVILPPFARAADVAPVLRRLKKKGITDYYRVRSGENRNAVSLGVFSQREIAERRFAEIKALGLKPRMELLSLPVVRYWLEVKWLDAPKAEKEWRGGLERDGLSADPVPCLDR